MNEAILSALASTIGILLAILLNCRLKIIELKSEIDFFKKQVNEYKEIITRINNKDNDIERKEWWKDK